MSYRNASIHPILRLIYALLRLITWLGLSIFFRRRLIMGREHLRFDGPAIVVCNHPNTLMDPLNIGLQIRQELYFLANYSLFKHPLSRWILSRLFCIPVKRKEDVAEGEARDNDAAFEASFQHLEKNGLLFIAAEGVSWMNRFVRPFKTGTARIAFGAERRNAWQLGVKIIPVGLSYDTPRLFRSRVTIEFGPPVEVAPWAAADQQHYENAVLAFSAELEDRVRALLLDSGAAEGDGFVDQAEVLFQNAFSSISDRERYLLLKTFLQKKRNNDALKQQMAQYFAAVQKAGLSDFGVGTPSGHGVAAIPLTLFAPLFVAGYGFWFLPCWLPLFLCKRLHLYPGYDSNVKMLAGLFTFPLALWGGWEIAFGLWGNKFGAWTAILALIGLGYFTEWYMDASRRWREGRAARKFQQKKPAEWEALVWMREALLAAIKPTNHARV